MADERRLPRSALGDEDPSVCIMVIDDDLDGREVLGTLLRRAGYEVVLCSGAASAFGHLREGAPPDLIVLDLMMPGMDGWEFRVEQKAEPRWAAIPIVVLSADHSAKARAIDAAACVHKPIDETDFLEVVHRVTRDEVHARSAARATEFHRLVSLGSLVGGLAHEINNPLALVQGTMDLLQRQLLALANPSRATEPFTVASTLRALERSREGVARITEVVREPERDRYAPPARRVGPPVTPARPAILLIDDEPAICELLAAQLSELYDVAAFTSPRAALASMIDGDFALIVCDVMMPVLSGAELYERAIRERPELQQRFLFVTGGAFTEHTRKSLQQTGRPTLHKPCSCAELLEAVHAALHAAR